MAYNTDLADRVREYLSEQPDVEIIEKKMFGGLAFMVNGKMCVNISEDQLMCRFNPQQVEEIAERPGYQPLIMKGKHYKGYCYVDAMGYKSKKDFSFWLNLCLEYNAEAKLSKKNLTKKAKGDSRVDDYINGFPKSVKEVLISIRATIKNAVPDAEEKYAYGLAGYYHNGPLLYFGAFKHHIGIYPMPSAIKAFSKELSVYKTAKGSVQFPHTLPFPYTLLKKMVKLRMKEQLAKSK